MARGLNVFVNIGAKVGSSVSASARAVERRFSQMGRSLALASAQSQAHLAATEKRWGKFSANASNFAHSVSMPAAALSAIGAKTAYDWAKVGNELQAVTGMNNDLRKSIEGVAKAQIGNPVENLRAALDLGRSGFDSKQIATSLPTVIKLAKSDSSVDTAAASDIATNVIQGMQMPVEKFAHAADLLAYGAAKSSTDVRLMGQSFKYAGPIASRLGLNMETLTATFMTMADAGIKGSESGVAFRSALVRLVKPTKGAMGVLARYNMKLSDYVQLSNKPVTGRGVVNSLKTQGINAAGATATIDKLLNNKSLSGGDLVEKVTSAVVEGLGESASAMDRDLIATAVTDAVMSGASKVDFVKFIEDAKKKGWTPGDLLNFFDTRQGARIATLFGDEFKKNLESMSAKGGPSKFLDKMFALQNKGVVGSMGRLAQSMGGLVIAMSDSGVLDSAANFIDKLAAGIARLGQANPAFLKFITYTILGLAVLAPLGFILGGVASGFKLLFGAIQFLAPLLLRAGPLLAKLGPMLVMGFGRALAALMSWIVPALLNLAPVVMEGLAGAFALLSNPVGWAIVLVGVAAALIYFFRDDIARAWPKVVAWFTNAFTAIKSTIMAINWAGVGIAIADSLTFGLASKLPGMVSGVKSALSNVRVGASITAPTAMPSSSMQGRAGGGSVSRGSLYNINERGQELFAPGRSGTIIPARATAALIAAMSGGMPMQAAAAPAIHVGQIVVQGATDPAATARAVRDEIKKLVREQARGLND